jgi:hypothetical protein
MSSKNQAKIYLWNANGIKSKIDEVVEFLQISHPPKRAKKNNNNNQVMMPSQIYLLCDDGEIKLI